MNIFRIFLESSLAAQIIMTILAIFSVWSWGIFFKKLFQFSRTRGRCNHFLSAYRFQHSVREWQNLGSLLEDSPYGRILKSGIEEYRKLKTMTTRAGQQSDKQQDIKWLDELSDNIRLTMERVKTGEISERSVSKHVAPFPPLADESGRIIGEHYVSGFCDELSTRPVGIVEFCARASRADDSG